MAIGEAETYILEQAKIEVEYTRSWPTKILAFYVVINFGLVTGLITLLNRQSTPPVSEPVRVLLIAFVVIAFLLGARVLVVNHLNYLKYRLIQIRFQIKHLEKLRVPWGLPPEWFNPFEPSWCIRFGGYGFFLFLMFLVCAFTVAALWYIR